MATLEETKTHLEFCFERIQNALELQKSYARTDLPDFVKERISQDIREAQREVKKILTNLVFFPPFHSRHFDKLKNFYKSGPFERSVFIMTKFPEGNGRAAKELQRVIKAVKKSISKRNYIPRVASSASFHEWIWDNVELHMLGSKFGVAIVEDRYKPEMNPNIAMEWGWMRALGRRVLFLKEKGFKHMRADWEGQLTAEFDWKSPAKSIERAIEDFLTEI